eukprot:3756966-Amphidinium_carterae.1
MSADVAQQPTVSNENSLDNIARTITDCLKTLLKKCKSSSVAHSQQRDDNCQTCKTENGLLQRCSTNDCFTDSAVQEMLLNHDVLCVHRKLCNTFVFCQAFCIEKIPAPACLSSKF